MRRVGSTWVWRLAWAAAGFYPAVARAQAEFDASPLEGVFGSTMGTAVALGLAVVAMAGFVIAIAGVFWSSKGGTNAWDPRHGSRASNAPVWTPEERQQMLSRRLASKHP
jgi:hypothetical protein